MYKQILLLLLLCKCEVSFSQLRVDAQEKFFQLNYLAQGKRNGHFLPATAAHKGSCSFEYQCKEHFFDPKSDTFNTLYKIWLTPIVTYALIDSLTYYDTLYYRIYPYNDSDHTAKYDVLDLSKIYSNIPFMTEEQRLVSLISILPFKADYKYLKDSTEIILTAIQGFSPPQSTVYTNTLTYLLYDYVYQKRHVPLIITYRENDRRYRYAMKPVDLW